MTTTPKRILILGGYGNFGSYICRTLAAEDDIQLIIAGRNGDKCKAFAKSLTDAKHKPEYKIIDARHDLYQALLNLKPHVVIHTCGPFQEQEYTIAKSCIKYGCHYLDLADGRDFVSGINSLHSDAKEKHISIISGASSVPGLSSAIIDHYLPQFQKLQNIDYGIATAQQTNRGLATTSSVLSYTGQGFTTLIDGDMRTVYGWQDLHRHRYPEFGNRFLGNCDIPDLELFPQYYTDLQNIRFYAGVEMSFMHLGLWLLSFLPRCKVIKSLAPFAKPLIKISNIFDGFGSGNSALHMLMSGIGQDGKQLQKTFHLTAKDGDGPYIPCMPAIILAKQLIRDQFQKHGAFPCVSLITLNTYLDALKHLNIQPHGG